MKRVKIFAFPYAMGGASSYAGLKERFTKTEIQIIPLDYPGHEARYLDDLQYSMQDIAMDIYQKISAELDEEYCLLGYSMGGTICYELYQIIKGKGRRLPLHIFLLAADHPGAPPDYTDCENMTSKRVRDIFSEMGSTPDEILQNDDMIELFLPIVEADLVATEKYVPTKKYRLECGVTLFRGTGEKNNEATLAGWNALLCSPCDYHIMDGGHFFMFDSDAVMDKVCGIIKKAIQ